MPQLKRKTKASGGKRLKRRAYAKFVVDPNAELSPYAKYATALFRRGVQRAYKDLANKGVVTVIMSNGAMVKGVPTRVGNKFVVLSVRPPKAIRSA